MPATFPSRFWVAAPDDREKDLKRFDYIVTLLLFAAALGIRLYLFPFHDVISVDGTGYVGAARKLMSGDISALGYYGLYPVMIGLIGLIGSDLETSAQLASAVMGSLLVVPLYLLGRLLFSRVTAIAACLLTIVWSSHLFVSCIVGNQAMYTTLALAGMYLVWRMFEGRSSAQGLWAGLVMGLAFLTRTEAFLLFFLLPLAPLLDKRREFRLLWQSLLAYGTVFALILCLNTVLVHHLTGAWQLSAKTSSALGDTLSYYLKIPDLNLVPGGNSVGYLGLIMKYPDLVLTNPIKNLKVIYETIVPFSLWLLAVIGLLAGGFDRRRMIGRLFLLCSFAPLVVIVVFYYINAGYVEPFLPVLFLWCAEGGRTIERFTTGFLTLPTRSRLERFTRFSPILISATCVYAFVLFPQIPEKRNVSAYTWSEDGGRYDHKRIGLLLKNNLPPGKLMTRWARLAYYSEHEQVDIPNTDLAGIEKAATEASARFLVIDGRLDGPRPQLDFLLTPLYDAPDQYFAITPTPANAKPGLYPYLVYAHPSSIGVIVYEIIR